MSDPVRLEWFCSASAVPYVVMALKVAEIEHEVRPFEDGADVITTTTNGDERRRAAEAVKTGRASAPKNLRSATSRTW